MYHPLCNAADLPVGEKRLIKLADHEFILYHAEQGFFATESRCPHLFKSLAKGKLDGNVIECPMHKARFDVRSGEPKEWANFPKGIQLLNKVRPPKALRTYDLVIEGGVVSLKIPKDMFL